jgi:hypothetical protein
MSIIVFTTARHRSLFWSRRFQFTLFYDLLNSILPSQSRLLGIVLLRSKRTYFHMFITKLLSLNNLFSKWKFVSHRKYFWRGAAERKTNKKTRKQMNFFEVSDLYADEYEDGCLLGCCAVYFCRYWPTFRRCLLPPWSGVTGLHGATSRKTAIFKWTSIQYKELEMDIRR